MCPPRYEYDKSLLFCRSLFASAMCYEKPIYYNRKSVNQVAPTSCPAYKPNKLNQSMKNKVKDQEKLNPKEQKEMTELLKSLANEKMKALAN